jgi:putative two-component system response regulator
MANYMENNKKTIFLVDSCSNNLTTGENILSGMYDVFTIRSSKLLFRILEKNTPDLILLEVNMPEINGYEIIKQLKINDHYKNIPVIFLIEPKQRDHHYEGLSFGAIDYFVKPLSPVLLVQRVDLHLSLLQQRDQIKSYKDQLQSLVLELGNFFDITKTYDILLKEKSQTTLQDDNTASSEAIFDSIINEFEQALTTLKDTQ